MDSFSNSFNSKNTSAKELIRKNIRHALASKNQEPLPNIDVNQPLFAPIDEPLKEFVDNFRKQGGRCLLSDKEQFLNNVEKFIQSQGYNAILCTINYIADHLRAKKISFQNVINANYNADLAIIYAESLIARSGSLLFTQKHSLYPSVKNLAKDLLIISFTSNVVPDVKQALGNTRKNEPTEQLPICEIVLPTKLETLENKEEYTPISPRFNLILIY
ncbi:MAG TPA: hypothetical protein PK548_00285 [Bacteroidales bacterium]|nr:hypothetical protein [Bacteroidales bacterium]HQA86276.1 hypothetical protein [Bacteroidales bacterium]